MTIFKCKGCGRANFKSATGLTQHQQRNRVCQPGYIERSYGKFDLDNDINGDGSLGLLLGLLPTTTVMRPTTRQSLATRAELEEPGEGTDDEDASYVGIEDDDSAMDEDNSATDDDNSAMDDDNSDDVSTNFDNPLGKIRSNFERYVETAQYSLHFDKNESLAIDLCHRLRQSKASLDTYEEVMQWHFVASKGLDPNAKVGNHPDFISRKKLFKILRKRYNYDATKWGIVKQITLPHCRARAKIICNDAQAVIQSLLTDP